MGDQGSAGRIRVVIAAPFPGIVQLHQHVIEDSQDIDVCAALAQVHEVLDETARLRPDVLLISDHLGLDLPGLTERLAGLSPETRILVLTEWSVAEMPGLTAEQVIDLETVADPSRLRGAILRVAGRLPLPPASERPPLSDREEPRGRVIVVHSGKGGVGKSVVAANLAVALSQRGAAVAIVDLDLHYGDVGVLLGVEAHPTSIDALVTPSSRAGACPLEEAMAYGPEGVRVLLAPVTPQLASAVSPVAMRAIIAELIAGHDYVVIDTPSYVDDRLRTLMAMADTILVVSAFSLTSVKDTKITLKLLETLGVERQRIAVVLNQLSTRSGFPRGDIESSLGFTVLAHLPHEPSIDDAIDSGTPSVLSDSRSDFASQFAVLCEHVSEVAECSLSGTEVDHRGRFGQRR